LTCLTEPGFAERVRDIFENEPTRVSTIKGVSGKIKEAVELYLTSAEGHDASFFFVVGADGEAVRYEGDRILQNATREHVLGTVLYGGSADDTYHGAATVIPSDDGQSSSSLNVIYDCGGNDAYVTASTRPVPTYDQMQFDTGGVAFGVSVLVDANGNDVYENGSFTHAAALGGVSLLINLEGNDRYGVVKNSVDGTELYFGAVNQGAAFWGIAALIDINGADVYRTEYMGQGLGGPAGVGVLMDHNPDVAGPDQYNLGGLLKEIEYTHVDRSRGYGQGLGLGLRYKYPGGVGILIDHGPGEDSFAGGTFSMGVGLIYGLGILHNSGSPNEQQGVYGDTYAPLRYGLGSAAHFSVGVMLDDAGDDVYALNQEFEHSGYIALCGFGWDLSYGLMMDKQGDDSYFYDKQPSASIGNGAQTGLGLFFDNGGSDYYNQRFTRETNFYHGGYSLGIAIDARQTPSEQDVFTDSRYERAPFERMLVTQTPARRLDEKADNSSITERLLFVQLLAGIEEPHNTPGVFKEMD